MQKAKNSYVSDKEKQSSMYHFAHLLKQFLLNLFAFPNIFLCVFLKVIY